MASAYQSPGDGADPFDPFGGGELEVVHPATPGQRAIWASIQLGGVDASRAYNESVRVHLRGPLDRRALERAFDELVARHEALRTSFGPGGVDVCVARHGRARVEFEDLVGQSPAAQEDRLRALMRLQATHTFDLVRGPLVRAWLVALSPTEHWIYFTGHHLVADGWSIAVVFSEWGELYSAAAAGRPSGLPPAERFSDYARGVEAELTPERCRTLEAFWMHHYREGVPTFELPLDHPRPMARTVRAARIDVEFDAGLIGGLRQVGQKNRASLVVTMSGAFAAYLSRVAGQPDVVLAVPSAGQALVGGEHLMGHAVNVMPLRAHLVPGERFVDYLARFRGAFADALDHQQLPLAELLRVLRVPRDPARIPLVPVTFNVDSGMDNFSFEGLEATYHSSPKEFGDFEVTINAAQLRGRFVVECTFNTDLFTAETMRRRMREWEVFLRGVVSAPETAVGNLPLLDDDTRREMLAAWNDTDAPFPDQGLHALVERWADATPDHVALVFGDRRLTYRDLDMEGNRLAHHLLAVGVERGHTVGIFLERSERMVVAALAVMKAGAAYVPIDPAYPEDRIAFMLEDIGADRVVTEAALAPRLPRSVRAVDLDGEASAIGGSPTGRPGRVVAPEDLAYVIYTSGSTGKPKGVLTPHRAVVNYVTSMARDPGVDARDVMSATASLSFDMSVFEIWVPLAAGATCVVLSREVSMDGGALGRALVEHGVTLNMMTPVSWQLLLDAGWEGSPVLRAMSGGEELPTALAVGLRDKVKKLYNVYGPTETTVLSHFGEVTRVDRPPSIGKPLVNVRAYILDGRGHPVPVGVTGELHIGGAGVALGYHGRPELTAERFVRDPFAAKPGARMYRSGDLAKFLPDGAVEWLGRIDGQVKIRGYRIELGEIEAALHHVGGVERAVVVPMPVDGEKQLVAYVVLRGGAKVLDEAAARAELRRTLPAYMLPAAFVVLDAIPISPSGKVDRKALPPPETAALRTGTKGVGGQLPETPVEEVLMDLWEEVLGVRPRRTDNFFDLGGQSLQAMRVIEGATTRGLDLRPTHMFQFPTLEELARHTALRSAGGAGGDDDLVALRDTGTRPPLYFLHSVPGDLLHYGPLVQRLGADQPAYGFQSLGLDPAAFGEWSIERLAARYVDRLLRLQPEGPYHFVGWCFGGNVALEMAQQLLRRGHAVGFVGLMESWPVRGARREAAHKVTRLLRMGTKALPAVEQKVRAMVSGEREQDPLKVFALDMTSGPFRNRNVVYRKNTEALKDYRSEFYPGRVWLFEAKAKPEGAIFDPDYGWRDFAAEVITVKVSGAHEDMLKPPHVDELARAMRAAIDEATAHGRRGPRSR